MLKIVYAGSPEISVPCLKKIAELQLQKNECCLLAVITNPDSTKGRSASSTPTPVGTCAWQISELFTEKKTEPPDIFKVPQIDSQTIKQIKNLQADILICFAYGTIFTPEFTDIFKLGGINVHPSLLPKYRGPTPIPAAILNRDAETGITIQKVAPKIDSGDILLQQKFQLNGVETTKSLSETVAVESAALLEKFLASPNEYFDRATAQNNNNASYCPLLKKDDALINWNDSAANIEAKIRAYNPWPMSYTFANDTKINVLEASVLSQKELNSILDINTEVLCNAAFGTVLGNNKKTGIIIKTGGSFIAVKRLQAAARKALDHNSFLNGAKDFIGTVLK
ncbi:MAG: methionyl-tRNA formyltransferase [Termitinemataceae bacterium]|nr:MAG: methionyl-tRNA formyltransferase [Termitinemataceae bacterium]